MTGKVLDSSATGILILILPLALVIVILYTAWVWILLLMALIVGWKIWQNYQWKQWCRQVNPFFNQLIRDNQGCLTSMDLSLKANLTGGAAERFLDKKAEEYGAQRKIYEDRGTVYYFLTASALGSIFDASEPPLGEDWREISPKKSPQLMSALAPFDVNDRYYDSSASNPSQPIELEIHPQSSVTPEQRELSSHESPSIASTTLVNNLYRESPTQMEKVKTNGSLDQPPRNLALIQSDLAKRLEINASTLGRRKSEPDFAEWSQNKDPEGIAWQYIPKTKMFIPLKT
jgi:hypothetical protein